MSYILGAIRRFLSSRGRREGRREDAIRRMVYEVVRQHPNIDTPTVGAVAGLTFLEADIALGQLLMEDRIVITHGITGPGEWSRYAVKGVQP